MTTFWIATAFTVRVLGRSTSIPDSRIGAVSMKMMSNTSMTSTKGVTLISESDVRVRPWGVVKAMTRVLCRAVLERLCEVPLRHVQELQPEVVHEDAQLLDALKEVVIRNHSWD